MGPDCAGETTWTGPMTPKTIKAPKLGAKSEQAKALREARVTGKAKPVVDHKAVLLKAEADAAPKAKRVPKPKAVDPDIAKAEAEHARRETLARRIEEQAAARDAEEKEELEALWGSADEAARNKATEAAMKPAETLAEALLAEAASADPSKVIIHTEEETEALDAYIADPANAEVVADLVEQINDRMTLIETAHVIVVPGEDDVFSGTLEPLQVDRVAVVPIEEADPGAFIVNPEAFGIHIYHDQPLPKPQVSNPQFDPAEDDWSMLDADLLPPVPMDHVEGQTHTLASNTLRAAMGLPALPAPVPGHKRASAPKYASTVHRQPPNPNARPATRTTGRKPVVPDSNPTVQRLVDRIEQSRGNLQALMMIDVGKRTQTYRKMAGRYHDELIIELGGTPEVE